MYIIQYPYNKLQGKIQEDRKMARHISEDFLNEFLTGRLKPILDYIHNDHTLDMELRGVEVTVYYRGSRLFSIIDKELIIKPLDKNYTNNNPFPDIINIGDFDNYILRAKHFIDVWFIKNYEWEREIQQQIVRENNNSPNAENTDYFILDIEYTDIGRADIVALRWDSTKEAHKNPESTKLTMFELKQGFNSIGGSSGIVKHYNDFKDFISDDKKVEEFKADMIKVFEQKRKLGLIPNLEADDLKGKVIQIVDKEIDFIFIIANYKSASSKLREELNKVKGCKFIYANAMGYGLFSKNIIEQNDFLNMFNMK